MEGHCRENSTSVYGNRMSYLLEIVAQRIENIQIRITSTLEENKWNRDDLSGKAIFLVQEQTM